MVKKDWYDDDEFWRIFGGCMFAEDSFRVAAEQLDDIFARTDAIPQKVLDLGCGPGRHAIPLAVRGCAVTAVDLSALLLAQATARAATQGVQVEWLRHDMRDFQRPGYFDLVLSMWTSFGYFDSPQDDLKVLRQCYRNLRPGGALLIDTVGKEYVVRNIQPVHLTEYENGDLLLERPILQANMTRYANQWTLIRDGRAQLAEWQHNLYSGQELIDRLLIAGFCEVSLFGSLAGDDYDLDSERLVAVAWK